MFLVERLVLVHRANPRPAGGGFPLASKAGTNRHGARGGDREFLFAAEGRHRSDPTPKSDAPGAVELTAGALIYVLGRPDILSCYDLSRTSKVSYAT